MSLRQKFGYYANKTLDVLSNPLRTISTVVQHPLTPSSVAVAGLGAATAVAAFNGAAALAVGAGIATGVAGIYSGAKWYVHFLYKRMFGG